jgi:arginase family enzyme
MTPEKKIRNGIYKACGVIMPACIVCIALHYISEAKDGPEYLFISFDIDVMDPVYTPATGTPEPNGLTPRETFPLIRRLCAESNVVGFELVELLPYRVSGYETVLNSERIVRECLVGLALRKKGITDEAYLAPLTVDDENR